MGSNVTCATTDGEGRHLSRRYLIGCDRQPHPRPQDRGRLIRGLHLARAFQHRLDAHKSRKDSRLPVAELLLASGSLGVADAGSGRRSQRPLALRVSRQARGKRRGGDERRIDRRPLPRMPECRSPTRSYIAICTTCISGSPDASVAAASYLPAMRLTSTIRSAAWA